MIGFFAGNGAFGDQAFNLCKIHAICKALNAPSLIVHTARHFFYKHNNNDWNTVPPNPDVLSLWSQCNLIDSICFDFDHFAFEDSLRKATEKRKHMFSWCPVEWASKTHKLKDWMNLSLYHKIKLEGEKKAIFQPISLLFKPKEFQHHYIMKWEKSIKSLLDKGYTIYTIGRKDDMKLLPSCISEDLLNKTINLIGQFSLMEWLEALLHQADFVLSCDSWSGLYGIANRTPTCIAWGYRMKNGIDTWLKLYLGNEDMYCYGWSEDREETDLKFAKWITDRI